MAMRILWPNLPAEFHQVAHDAVGPGFETEFCANAADVTDEQWANAVGSSRVDLQACKLEYSIVSPK